jgi:hypothetical protein
MVWRLWSDLNLSWAFVAAAHFAIRHELVRDTLPNARSSPLTKIKKTGKELFYLALDRP